MTSNAASMQKGGQLGAGQTRLETMITESLSGILFPKGICNVL
ncbi:hypothetical protein SAMN04488005_0545 [Yoonia tamlensis]|uniref:Uncharacterized protein n=1 Tax=Yoonia tamlensis TaxID=390270 RepID=A0A1I6FV06_9RHOB|nr:hypothetical protein SAMN04488005_0545 [Yoonia tamlensis]